MRKTVSEHTVGSPEWLDMKRLQYLTRIENYVLELARIAPDASREFGDLDHSRRIRLPTPPDRPVKFDQNHGRSIQLFVILKRTPTPSPFRGANALDKTVDERHLKLRGCCFHGEVIVEREPGNRLAQPRHASKPSHVVVEQLAIECCSIG